MQEQSTLVQVAVKIPPLLPVVPGSKYWNEGRHRSMWEPAGRPLEWSNSSRGSVTSVMTKPRDLPL